MGQSVLHCAEYVAFVTLERYRQSGGHDMIYRECTRGLARFKAKLQELAATFLASPIVHAAIMIWCVLSTNGCIL
ncbi:hypothetical protein NTGBS_370002 [Candidatus Nitrotoga sp. BS]|nr:hypothetical protein NTGBS_370002 [Candidatus Nitrotoga sp. BS]